MLYVLVIVLFSGEAVVIERDGFTAADCRATGERLVEQVTAALFQCFERVDV